MSNTFDQLELVRDVATTYDVTKVLRVQTRALKVRGGVLARGAQTRPQRT